jgi:hypothetical protein
LLADQYRRAAALIDTDQAPVAAMIAVQEGTSQSTQYPFLTATGRFPR